MDKSIALNFEEEISLKLNDFGAANRDKVLSGFDIFKQIVDACLYDEKVYFSGIHSKLLFLYNKYKFSDDLQLKINNYRKFIRKLTNNEKLYCSKEDVEATYRICLKILEVCNGGLDDHSLSKFLDEEPILEYSATEENEAESFELVITSRSKENSTNKIIFGDSEECGKVAIYLNRTWESIWSIVKPYCNVRVMNVEKQFVRENYSVYYCNPGTMLVYESDFLVDVTEIANCFQNTGQSEYFALLNWLSISLPSTPMLIGNIVNTLFDSLISNEEIDISEFIETELAKSPLQYLYLNKYEYQNLGNLSNNVELIFSKIRKTIEQLPQGDVYIEPSFISASYGLQGRLDAMIVDVSDSNRKEVVELKSGGFPTAKVPIKTSNGSSYLLTTWRNHYVQASCYNLILRDTYKNRYGNSSIYYAKDDKRPFRNAPILEGNYQEIIDLRNKIVALYIDLANGNFTSFANLADTLYNFPPSYWAKDVERFTQKLNNSTPIAHEYLKEMISFVARELISNKIGKFAEKSEKSYNSLWRNNNKSNSRNILNNLTLDKDECDFEKYYLNFSRNEDSEVNFRIGDQIIVYPADKDSKSLLLEEQLLKGVIKQIDENRVIISLRNKLLVHRFLEAYNSWTIESDFLEHSLKKLPSILFDFIDDDYFDIKVGLLQQKHNEFPDIKIDYLNEKQNNIVRSAIEAENYYFIQGPPGTGKTSYILRALVEYYHTNSSGNILLTAYTNKAVDHICAVLKERTDIDFIRLGSKESSEHSNELLSMMIEDYSLSELKEKFAKTRVFVSTVSSILSHQELFELKTFEVGIVDEAAQILEPLIVKIIHKCKKYVMIGDEKQLPAIVSQSKSNYEIDNDNLHSILLSNLSESYFERMVRISKRNDWDRSYGMLTHQGRMSSSIMNISNMLFYNGKLLSLNKNSSESEERELTFYGVDSEDTPYINYSEANYIVTKIKDILCNDNNLDITIGVISPFRSQCGLIRNLLPLELKNRIDVDTVERFQGSERDIIFISFAANKVHHLPQLSSIVEIDDCQIDRKLNVAVTRAKKQLIATGCKEVLDKSPIHKRFIELMNSK